MKWIDETVALAVHEEQLAEHGGPLGLRDPSILQSALARPRNLLAYGAPDIADLAASYAYGLVKDHPFVDGNKRVSLVVTETFLILNGLDLTASDADCLAMWMSIASGELSEIECAAWLRRNIEGQ